MNRRQLFLSTAKAALAAAVGGSWLFNWAKAQTPAPTTNSGPPTGATGDAFGSPFGTRSVPGYALPAPELPFQGVTNRNPAQSTPWGPRLTVPPKGAPNVLLVMTDASKAYGR
jgi:arylsulfatase